MSKKQKKTILIAGAVLLAVIMIVTVLGKIEKEPKVDSNLFKEVTDIPGCEFAVNRNSSDTATTVMEISKTINFLDYETYRFCNGEDLYLLFNMNRYIVAVKKGTSFNLSETEPAVAFQNNSLSGIWFEVAEDAKLKKKGNTSTIEVTAQVVITNTLYNDFTGKLITIEKDGEEWTMFTGFVHADDEESIAMVDYISSTFKASEVTQVAQADFEVNIEEGIKTEEPSANEDVSEEISEPISEEASEVVSEEISETTTEDISEDVSEEFSVSEEESEKPSDPPEEKEEIDAKENETLTASSTQREVEDNVNTAYSSTVYSMLPVGSIGYMDILNEEIGKTEPAYIKVLEIHDEAETNKLIAEYEAQTGNKIYSTMEIPDGCHIEAVTYEVRYTSENWSYVDIKLCSLSGEELRYRGMPYSSKTYDICKPLEENNDWVQGYTAFYIIPDGCTEYALRCSGIINNDETRPAWFYVNTR